MFFWTEKKPRQIFLSQNSSFDKCCSIKKLTHVCMHLHQTKLYSGFKAWKGWMAYDTSRVHTETRRTAKLWNLSFLTGPFRANNNIWKNRFIYPIRVRKLYWTFPKLEMCGTAANLIKKPNTGINKSIFNRQQSCLLRNNITQINLLVDTVNRRCSSTARLSLCMYVYWHLTASPPPPLP